MHSPGPLPELGGPTYLFQVPVEQVVILFQEACGTGIRADGDSGWTLSMECEGTPETSSGPLLDLVTSQLGTAEVQDWAMLGRGEVSWMQED